MASINVRKESGCLYIDFRYRNVRCREQTELRDTPKNRSRLQALLDRIEAEILLGQFDYAATFPNSSRVKVIQRLDSKYQKNEDVPLFKSFCQTWLDEMSVQWRDSYKKTVNGIVFKRLIPEFGELRINLISRENLLSFRANLASLKSGDAWGNYYRIDENELELSSSDCRQDSIQIYGRSDLTVTVPLSQPPCI